MRDASSTSQDQDRTPSSPYILKDDKERDRCWGHLVGLDTAFDRRMQAVLSAEAFLIASVTLSIGKDHNGARLLILLICILGIVVSCIWCLVQIKILSQMNRLRQMLFRSKDTYYLAVRDERKVTPFVARYSIARLLGWVLPAIFVVFWTALAIGLVYYQ